MAGPTSTQDAFDLDRAEAMASRFATEAAHDLQEPLRLLSGYLDLVCAHLDGKVTLHGSKLAHEARATTERMQKLVGSLLESSRVATAPLPDTVIALADPLDDAVKNMRLRLAETGAVVTHGPLPSVRGDTTQLTRLFQNIIENSLKYAGGAAAPVVHVTAQHHAGAWMIVVDDNGPGWPPHGRERLFRPFTRLHGGDVPGNGMGLAMVRAIVEHHGGHVEATDAPQGGARVQITFPEASR